LIAAAADNERNAQGKVDLDWMVQPDLYGSLLTQSPDILSAPQIDALRQLVEQSLVQPAIVTKKAVKASGGQSRPAATARAPGS
jgi:hypothetical protein